jgi:hypothetical protein
VLEKSKNILKTWGEEEHINNPSKNIKLVSQNVEMYKTWGRRNKISEKQQGIKVSVG